MSFDPASFLTALSDRSNISIQEQTSVQELHRLSPGFKDLLDVDEIGPPPIGPSLIGSPGTAAIYQITITVQPDCVVDITISTWRTYVYLDDMRIDRHCRDNGIGTVLTRTLQAVAQGTMYVYAATDRSEHILAKKLGFSKLNSPRGPWYRSP